MISKEKFIGYINYIEETYKKEEAFNEGLSKCFGDSDTRDIFVFSADRIQMVKMLCDLMDVEYDSDDIYGDDISYFVYECEFGKYHPNNCIEVNGKKYSLRNAEDLYYYILDSKWQAGELDLSKEMQKEVKRYWKNEGKTK